MKKIIIAILLILLIKLTSRAADYWTISLTVTNPTTSTGKRLIINGQTRYSSNILTSISWVTNNNVGTTVTNIFNSYAAFPQSGVICELVSSNQLNFKGFNLTFQIDSGIGYYTSNKYSSPNIYTLTLPIDAISSTNWTKYAYDVINLLEQATNSFSVTNKALSNYVNLNAFQIISNKAINNANLTNVIIYNSKASGLSITNLNVYGLQRISAESGFYPWFMSVNTNGSLLFGTSCSSFNDETNIVNAFIIGNTYYIFPHLKIGAQNPLFIWTDNGGRLNAAEVNTNNLAMLINILSYADPIEFITSEFFENKGEIIVGLGRNLCDTLPPGVNGQVLSVDASSPTGLRWITPAFGGSVTSVDFEAPSDVFGWYGTPITTSGKITLTNKYQAAGTFFAGPVSGTNAAPTFRTLYPSDIPAGISASKIGSGVVNDTEFSYLDGLTSRALGTNELKAGANVSIVRSNNFFVFDVNVAGGGGGGNYFNPSQFMTNGQSQVSIKQDSTITNLTLYGTNSIDYLKFNNNLTYQTNNFTLAFNPANNALGFSMFGKSYNLPITLYSLTNYILTTNSTSELFYDLANNGIGSPIIPANYLKPGKTIRIYGSGIHYCPSSGYTTPRIYIGDSGTNAWSQYVGLNSGQNGRPFYLRLEITCWKTGTDGKISGTGWFGSQVWTYWLAPPSMSIYGESINTTVDNEIKISFQNTVTSVSFVFLSLSIEISN